MTIKLKILPVIAGVIDGSKFLTASRSGRTYTINVNYRNLAELSPTAPGTSYFAFLDEETSTYKIASLTALLASGLDADLQAIAALSSTGILVRTASNTWALRSLTAPAAGITITNPAGVGGDPAFALANDLAAYEGLTTTGLVARTATDAAATRAITGPAAGVTVTNGDGVAGNPTLALANDLAAVEGLSATGLVRRTGVDTWSAGTTVATTEIADDAVTFAKIQNIASDRLIGRDTALTGDPEEIAVGGGLEFTGIAGIQRSALTGDVAAPAGSNATTISNNAVTYAKLQDISVTQRVLGRNTAGAGDTEELQISTVLDWLGSTQGQVLYRSATEWTVLPPGVSGQFLKTLGAGANPAWSAVPGGGDLLSTNNLSDVASKSASRANLEITGRNRLTNGTFMIDQRNAAVATTVADNVYWADRWRYLGEVSATCTARDTALISGDFNGAITFAGTTDKGGAFQVVVGDNCKFLRGQAVVFSAYLAVNNATLGNIKMGILEWTGTEDATTADPVSVWGADGVTPTLAAGWAFLNTPANMSVTTISARYQVTATVGASANNLAVLIWNDDKAYTAGDFFRLARCQLELGSNATPYENQPFHQVLEACKRHYRKSYDHLTAPGTVVATGCVAYFTAGTGGEAAPFVPYTTTMYSNAPTLTFYSPTTGASGKKRNASDALDENMTGVNVQGSQSHSGSNTVHLANKVYQYHYTAAAEI